MKSLLQKTAAVVMVICMLAAFAGCTAEQPSGDRLSRIKAKKEITIACEGTWAPWSFHDEDDNLVGFDVEVGKAIAEKLGVTPKFAEGDWDTILAGIEAGRYDLMINGVDVTEDRQKKYDFSIPYAYNHTALIVRTDNEEIKTFEDLKGKVTCNSINSTYMLLAEDYGAEVQGVESLEETLNMVLAGRVDATLNSEDSFGDYMKAHPEAELKVAALTEEAQLVAIPMTKGEDSDTLREAVDKAVEELRKEGKLSEISVKYFGRDITNE